MVGPITAALPPRSQRAGGALGGLSRFVRGPPPNSEPASGEGQDAREHGRDHGNISRDGASQTPALQQHPHSPGRPSNSGSTAPAMHDHSPLVDAAGQESLLVQSGRRPRRTPEGRAMQVAHAAQADGKQQVEASSSQAVATPARRPAAASTAFPRATANSPTGTPSSTKGRSQQSVRNAWLGAWVEGAPASAAPQAQESGQGGAGVSRARALISGWGSAAAGTTGVPPVVHRAGGGSIPGASAPATFGPQLAQLPDGSWTLQGCDAEVVRHPSPYPSVFQ